MHIWRTRHTFHGYRVLGISHIPSRVLNVRNFLPVLRLPLLTLKSSCATNCVSTIPFSTHTHPYELFGGIETRQCCRRGLKALLTHNIFVSCGMLICIFILLSYNIGLYAFWPQLCGWHCHCHYLYTYHWRRATDAISSNFAFRRLSAVIVLWICSVFCRTPIARV